MAAGRALRPRSESGGVTVDRLNAIMRDRLPGYGRLVPQIDASLADFPVDPLEDRRAADGVAERVERTST